MVVLLKQVVYPLTTVAAVDGKEIDNLSEGTSRRAEAEVEAGGAPSLPQEEMDGSKLLGRLLQKRLGRSSAGELEQEVCCCASGGLFNGTDNNEGESV